MFVSDILIEVTEIFINVILFIRGVYPKQIFEKKKAFNVLVYSLKYPPLKEYISNVLKTAKELNANGALQQIDIVFYKDEMTKYEVYTIKINNENPMSGNSDTYLVWFEEEIKKSLLMFVSRIKDLHALPSDTKFKINLRTTQSAFSKLSHNIELQNFLWLQGNESGPSDKFNTQILPLTSIKNVGIQIIVKQF